MLAQRATGFLVQLFDFIGDILAWDHTQAFGQTEGKAAGKPGQGFIAAHRQQGFKVCGHLAVDEMLQTPTHFIGDIRASFFIHKRFDAGTRRFSALDQLAHRLGAPHQAPLLGEIQLGIGCVIKTIRPQMEFRL